MKSLRLLAAGIAFTGLSAAGVATAGAVRVHPATRQSVPVTAVTAVCPDISGRGTGFDTRLAVMDTGAAATSGGGDSAGMPSVTLKLLDGHATGRSIDVAQGYDEDATRSGGPVAVAATGAGAADVAASQIALESHGARRGLAATNCVRPAADWWFVGADGRVGYDDDLVLANAADTAATVQVSLFSSSRQPVTAPSLESVTVPADGSTIIRFAKVAPNVANLAVHVRASSGLVAAALRDGRISGTDPQGSDWIPASAPPADQVLVPGLIAGPGDRHLVIANPDRRAVTANLQLVTDDGSFAPNGHSTLDIPGHGTTTLELASALRQRYAAVRLTASQPILASVEAEEKAPRQLPDLLWRAGSPPLRAGDVWPQVYSGDGRSNYLSLTAPAAAARVTLRDAAGKTTVVRVHARSSTVVVPDDVLHASGDGAGWVAVDSVTGGPVYAALTVREAGAHGPLVAGIPAVQPPSPVRVPATRYDQRIVVNP